jgi:DNA-binding NtrC family response regulator
MGKGPIVRDILLIAADWQARALTLAELQEAGYEVMALPGLRYGLKAVLLSRVAPRLVLLDVWHDDFAAPDRVRDLIRALPGIPVVLITGTFEREAYAALEGQVSALLARPVRVGDIVKRVKELLPPPGA